MLLLVLSKCVFFSIRLTIDKYSITRVIRILTYYSVIRTIRSVTRTIKTKNFLMAYGSGIINPFFQNSKVPGFQKLTTTTHSAMRFQIQIDLNQNNVVVNQIQVTGRND